MRLLSLAVPVLLVAPIAWRLLLPGPPPKQIDTVVREAGFNPVHPPTRLTGPGALYAVTGDVYWKVCGVNAALLDGKIEKSPAESISANTSRHAALLAELVDRLIIKLGIRRQIAVNYRISDVAVSNISLANLFRIEKTLLSQRDCSEAVDEVIGGNVRVCAVGTALSATVTYQKNVDDKYEFNGTGVEPHGSMMTTDNEHRAGENLFYGIRLWSQCITPDTATEPSVLGKPQKLATES